MKISRKPRHWIAILLALATTVVAGIAFADFSGEPEPRWRYVATRLGVPLTLLACVGNYFLERRAPPANQEHVARKK